MEKAHEEEIRMKNSTGEKQRMLGNIKKGIVVHSPMLKNTPVESRFEAFNIQC